MIEKAVSQFWDGLDVDKEKLCLTIDEYLSIFMYVIIQSKLNDLEAHLLLIELFVDEFTLFQSKAGQVYLTVQQAAIFLRVVDEQRINEPGYLKNFASRGLS